MDDDDDEDDDDDDDDDGGDNDDDDAFHRATVEAVPHAIQSDEEVVRHGAGVLQC